MLQLQDAGRVLRKQVKSLAEAPLIKKIEIALVFSLLIVTLALPLFFGTKAYPVAIVEGNSMYPTLQGGDMVLFKAANTQNIPNGTIIVFVQSDTGISSLDGLLKPIIIHRVVGSFMQADGTVYYVTKGDNNNFNDPSAVAADHILGVPSQVIPKLGFLLLFFSSPQGLVALIGFITLFYLGTYEGKLNESKTKDTFLGAVANMVINGELPEEAFKRFELAVKYVSADELETLKEGLSQALIDWLGKSAKEKGWKVHNTICPSCSEEVTSYEGSDKVPFIVCPRCIWKKGKIGAAQITSDQL
jgi:signal peptidase I